VVLRLPYWMAREPVWLMDAASGSPFGDAAGNRHANRADLPYRRRAPAAMRKRFLCGQSRTMTWSVYREHYMAGFEDCAAGSLYWLRLLLRTYPGARIDPQAPRAAPDMQNPSFLLSMCDDTGLFHNHAVIPCPILARLLRS